jgi:N-acetylglucosaminyl-diphospho-decaprenol L-rhamnosyltransferase
MVRQEFPSALLLCNTGNVGFVKANNQGLAGATGQYLFMLNSDAEVRPGAVERLVEVLARDRTIGAVGPRLLNTDGSPQVSVAPFPRVIHRLLPSRFEHAYNQRLEQRVLATTTSLSDVDWVCGAALLTRRDVLERVGPLDERYFMWWDDIDWSRKLAQAGYRRVFVADAEVVHHGRQSGRQVEGSRLAEQLFDSEYTYLRLHAGRAATCLVYAMRIAKAALVRLHPTSPERRRLAAWRLAYHRRNLARFCLAPMPPQPRWDRPDDAVGRQPELPGKAALGGPGRQRQRKSRSGERSH